MNSSSQQLSVRFPWAGMRGGWGCRRGCIPDLASEGDPGCTGGMGWRLCASRGSECGPSFASTWSVTEVVVRWSTAIGHRPGPSLRIKHLFFNYITALGVVLFC
jgi:hypothetical protein